MRKQLMGWAAAALLAWPAAWAAGALNAGVNGAAGVGKSVGLTHISATARDGPVTLFYPTGSPAQPLRRGPFTLVLAEDGTPQRANGRLVVISHGSGASPWVQADLAASLVQAGFVVALPEHRADSVRDTSRPGPDSWAQRPAEVSRAIDAVAQDPRFAPLLKLDKVGVYGMSAGGHTALSLAGGRWSRAGFKAHCQAHLADDFQACVGLMTRLTSHGALLSPLPPGFSGLEAALLNDPPGFERASMADVHTQIGAFLARHLLP